MTTDIGHERCSELLLHYERGKLSAPEADAVERHLGTCSRCSQERAGLAMLIDDDVEPLSASERSHLHAALAEEMRRSRETEARLARPHPRPSLWSRITSGGAGRLVGVAATLLVLVGAVVFGPRLIGGNGVQEAASGGAGAEVEVQGGPDPVFAAPVLPSAPEAIPEAGQARDLPDEAEEAGRAQLASPDELDSVQKLGAFASTSKPFTTFATAFGAEDVAALRDLYVDKLAQKAGRALETLSLDPSPAEVIRTCAQLAIEESPNPLLPAYATYAPVEGIDSLVLGFVYSEDGEGPVDRYTVLAWPGADCDAAPTFVSGDIAAPK
jgi:hypothetical protein